MTVKEKLRQLENSDEYLIDRMKTSNQFIEMVKTMMPDDYDRIREKEDAYQQFISQFEN